jgi:phage terminase small subunit
MDPVFTLNAMQQKFVEEYLVDLNGKQAAIRAGYSPIAAQETASGLLSLPKVNLLVRAGKRAMAADAKVRTQDVIAGFGRIAFFDVRRLFDEETGQMLPISELPDDIAYVVQGLEVSRSMEQLPDGSTAPKVTYKLKFADRTKALDSLARHLGLYEADNRQTNPVDTLMDFIASRKSGAMKPVVLEAETLDMRPQLPALSMPVAPDAI